jgi:hypothetical protein
MIDMNQKDLKIKNDMLAKISALRASIEALKITDGKEYKELLKSNEKILKKVEDEYNKFMDKSEKNRLAEIKRKQDEGQKIIKDEIAFVGEYLAYVSKLKLGERPKEEMLIRFNIIKRKPHVLTHLRNMKLKGL